MSLSLANVEARHETALGWDAVLSRHELEARVAIVDLWEDPAPSPAHARLALAALERVLEAKRALVEQNERHIAIEALRSLRRISILPRDVVAEIRTRLEQE